MRILVVCTGNICRSPMAAAFLRTGSRVVDVPMHVASSGFVADDEPAARHAIAVMKDWSLDISGHRSHRTTRADVVAADLIVTMAREHVLEVVALEPAAFVKTFTLKELVRRGVDIGPRKAEETLDAWVARVGAGRTPGDLLGARSDDDVDDPIGSSRRQFRRTAEELDRLVWALLDLLSGYAPQGSGL